jgi:ribonucleoside-diphosphate reductase alpha chain
MSKIKIVKRNGKEEPLYVSKIEECCKLACEGISDVDPKEIIKEAISQLYNGVSSDKIYEVLMLVSKTKIIDCDPNYSFVAAKFLLMRLYKESIGRSVKSHERNEAVKKSFKENIEVMVKHELLSPKLLTDFDLDELTEILVPERDNLFEYPGLQTLYDRYFIHLGERHLETPQTFFMRVSMGLCLNEKPDVRNYWVKRIYDKISTFKFMPSSPTLFNSGTCHPQLSSCYLSTVDDDLEGIYGTIHAQALLSKCPLPSYLQNLD